MERVATKLPHYLDGRVTHPTSDEIETGLDDVRRSPANEGTLRLIVRRPAVGERETLESAELDLLLGLVGDSWSRRPSSRTPDGSAHPDMQLNLMNSRAIALFAGTPERWALAGDQLFVDLDLSKQNLPPGTRLSIGGAVIAITDQPHRGCAKFRARFGADALRVVNSRVGSELNLRGVCARVVRAGTVNVGDTLRKIGGGAANSPVS
jgi:hypothetical protein